MSNFILVGLVGCGKKKIETEKPVPAGELYTGNLFRNTMRFAIGHCQHVFIVSAQYGLLHPTQPVMPYEKKITDLCKGERNAWAIAVVRSLYGEMRGQFGHNGDPLFRAIILAGAAYADLLHEELRWNRIPSCRPMRGLGQGQRMKWLSQFKNPPKKHPPSVLST